MQMLQVQIVLICQSLRQFPPQIFINQQSTIQAHHFRYIEILSSHIKQQSHSPQKRLIDYIHFFINQLLGFHILLDLSVSILTFEQDNAAVESNWNGQQAKRKGEGLLLTICFIRRIWWQVVQCLYFLQLLALAQWIQSIQQASGAFDCSVQICRINLNLSLCIGRVKQIQSLNIFFPDHSAQILVLPHAYRSEFSPQIFSLITIIKRIGMISGAMSEELNNLSQFTIDNNDQEHQQYKSFVDHTGCILNYQRYSEERI